MFAYCGNNPVSRVDAAGAAWETVLDVVSIGVSIAEVTVNPLDPWAWAGLAGDMVDLIPFLTGIGEATRAIKITVSVADGAEDVVDSARKSYSALKRWMKPKALLKQQAHTKSFMHPDINMSEKVDSTGQQHLH